MAAGTAADGFFFFFLFYLTLQSVSVDKSGNGGMVGWGTLVGGN
jgi:hypothetical protein